jgi:hypothetical protein
MQKRIGRVAECRSRSGSRCLRVPAAVKWRAAQFREQQTSFAGAVSFFLPRYDIRRRMSLAESIMLVTLSLVFCLLGQPGHCQTIRPGVEDGWSGLASCVLRGQLLAAQWLTEHPKWQLDRIRCTPANPPRTDDI